MREERFTLSKEVLDELSIPDVEQSYFDTWACPNGLYINFLHSDDEKQWVANATKESMLAQAQDIIDDAIGRYYGE